MELQKRGVFILELGLVTNKRVFKCCQNLTNVYFVFLKKIHNKS
jgi:hypothetical protein